LEMILDRREPFRRVRLHIFYKKNLGHSSNGVTQNDPKLW